MNRFCALSFALLAAAGAAQGQIIYDNGPLSTGPTTQSGVNHPQAPTVTWSEVQNDTGNCAESNTVAGYSSYRGTGTTDFRLADDFTVPDGEIWELTHVHFFAYQTGGTAITPPFTAATLRIWDGRPGDAGSTVIFGDTTTNRLANSNFANLNRVFNTTCPPPGTVPGLTRNIWRANIAADIDLEPGTYWVDMQVSNAVFGVMFSPNTTYVGQRGVAGSNARQYQNTFWADVIDAGNPATAPDVPQDIAFQVSGTVTGDCPADWNGDGFLTGEDFDEFVEDFEAGEADYNGDGFTTAEDFDEFSEDFEAGC